MSVSRVAPDERTSTRTGSRAAGHPRRTRLGLAAALFSAATFATSGTFATALMATGWTPAAVVTARVSLAALLLTPPALIQLSGRFGLLIRAWRTLLGYGAIAVAGCQMVFFAAVQRLDVGVALLLEYLGIVLVVLWMWLRHDERPGRLTGAGIAAALTGLVLVLDPGAGGGLNAAGVLLGLLAAAGLAVYFVMSAHGHDGLPPIVMAWGGLVVGAVGLGALDLAGVLPYRTVNSDVVLFGHATSWWVPVVALGLVAAALAYATGIIASRLLGARLASFVGLTEVLFAVLIAWAVLGQAPGGVQLLGGLVVLAGIALVRVDDLRRAAA